MPIDKGFHDEDKFGDIYDDIFELSLTGKRDPELEKEIIDTQNADAAYSYARYIIKGRWPEAEEIIKTVPNDAYWYARGIIKGRWQDGEEIIKTDSEYAYFYARDVIKGRWPEAEKNIKQNRGWWEKYKSVFNIQESFNSKVDEAVDNLNIIQCPHCNKSITWLSNESASCRYCGWKQEPTIDAPNLQFGGRFSELARMRPAYVVPGINAAQVGSGVAD